MKNKHRTPNRGQQMMMLGGPRENGARQAFRKATRTFGKVFLRTYPPEKGSSDDFSPHKGRGKDQKEKGKERAHTQSGLSASETPSEEGYSHVWESDDWYSSLTDDSCCSTTAWYGTGHTAWMASVPLNLAHHPTHVVLDLGCTRSIGSRATIRRFQQYASY